MADPQRLRDARSYRGQQVTLVEQFVDELRDLVGIVFGSRRPEATDAPDLIEVAAPLVRQFGAAGASLADDFYTRQREAARLTQGFVVRPADPVSDEVVGRSVSWALRDRQAEARERLAALRERRERAIEDADARAAVDAPALDDGVIDVDNLDDAWRSDLEGAMTRHAHNPGRRTLETAIRDDPEAVAWYRIARPDACSFCLMLMSRGGVFLSEDTARYREGTTDPYHDHCRCAVTPAFRNDPLVGDLEQEIAAARDLWYSGPAYFTGGDARNAMARAVRAQRAGRNVRAAVFDGPANDPDRYRSLITHDEATVEEFRRRATRNGRNGAPTSRDAADDPRFR